MAWYDIIQENSQHDLHLQSTLIMNEIGAKKAGAAFFRKDRKVDNCHEGALQYFWVRSKIAMPSASSPLTIIHHHSPDQNILLLGLSRVSMSLDQFSAPQQPSK